MVVNQGQNQAAHVGQQFIQPVLPNGGQQPYQANPYCGLIEPICPTACPQRRLIGGFSDGVAANGGAGVITIQSQIPVVMRCWGIGRRAAPFVRFTGIVNGVCNLILGGTIYGDAGLPYAITCGSVVDGYALLPGQRIVFSFTNISAQAVDTDIWLGVDLLDCP